MKKVRRVRRWTCRALVVLLVYCMLGTIIPYTGQKTVGNEARAWLDEVEYTAEAVGPDRITLIENTWEAYGIRAEMVRAAEETLDIVYYTIDGAESSEAFLGEVIAAADRGVKIRILTDAKMGSSGSSARALKIAAAHENITWWVYNPFNPLTPWTWQSVLHDKFILADGTYLVLGGRNIGDRFFNPEDYNEAVTDDRDVFVWRTDAQDESVLDELAAYMELLWTSDDVRYKDGGSRDQDSMDRLTAISETYMDSNPQYFELTLTDYLDRSVETNKITLLYNPIHTGKKEPWVAYGVYRMAEMGEEDIWIQTPYATGNRVLLDALEERAENVAVNLLTNSMASSPNFPAYSNYNANRGKFLDTGVTIYEYQSTDSIHGKSVVVDGRLSAVGSLNLDDRSIYLDTETMLIIDSEPFAEELLSALTSIRVSSLEVTAEGGYVEQTGVTEVPAGTFKRIGMWITSLFSRLFQFLI